MTTIEPVTVHDLDQLYYFLETVPELQVMPGEPFMDKDEFELAVLHRDAVSLVCWAPGHCFGPAGFIHARINDADSHSIRSACIVYIAVRSSCRGFGIGRDLLGTCRKALADRGVGTVYLWADETSRVIEFMEAKGFRRGKRCVWMEAETNV